MNNASGHEQLRNAQCQLRIKGHSLLELGSSDRPDTTAEFRSSLAAVQSFIVVAGLELDLVEEMG